MHDYRELAGRIARRLTDIEKSVMTQAETEIVDLLILHDVGDWKKNEDGTFFVMKSAKDK